jgi:hypothetical protein
MIQIHINPARVEKILFVAESEIEEDFDFAAWQAIRPLVDQIDQRLGRIVRELTRKRRADDLDAQSNDPDDGQPEPKRAA